jgi:hypothetical protein
VRVDEGGNPMKVGSLFGDKPLSLFFETLWYRRQGLFPSGKGSSFKYVRGRCREGGF